MKRDTRSRYYEHYTNKEVRERFKKFEDNYLFGSLKELAKDIDVSYCYLSAWRNESRDMGQPSLFKIMNFLDGYVSY